jgi:transcriptional regulator with XRE-family HTH domain
MQPKINETRYRTALEAAVQYLKDNDRVSSATDIADELKMSKGTLSTYISGKSDPSKNFIQNFEDTYRIKLEDFSMYTAASYSTKLARGNVADTKKPDEDLTRRYLEFIKRLEAENDKLREDNRDLRNKVNELIDKLIQKT